HLRRELVWFHVVIRPPHRARVLEAHFARALVGQFDKTGVILAVLRRDFVPSRPCFLQLFRIAPLGQDLFEFAEALTFLLSFAARGARFRRFAAIGALLRAIFEFAICAFHA